MATSTSRKRRKKKDPAPTRQHSEHDVPPPKRSGGRLRRYAIGFGLLVLLAWAAPMIVGYTPLRDYALGFALKDLNGSVSSSSASLGWFSPATLQDVEIRDGHGELVVRVPTIKTSRSLRQIVTNLSSLGRIEIQRPEIRVRFDETSSNLERALAKYLNSETEPTLDSPALEVEVTDATVVVEDHVTRQGWRLEQIGVKAALAHNWSKPMSLHAAGKLAQGGHFDAQVALARSQNPTDGAIVTSGSVQCDTANFPLSIAEPLARRFESGTNIAGWLNGKASFQWGPQGSAEPRMTVDADFNIEQLAVRSPAIDNETLKLARVDVPCRITSHGSRLRIERFAPRCDVGQVILENGPVEIDLSGGVSGLVEASKNNNYKLHGELDIAKLAQLLPQTLSVREGTQITDGKLKFNVTRSQQSGSGGWRGQLFSTSLRAINRGQPLSWENPIAAKFDVEYTAAKKQAAREVMVNKLTCWSEGLFLFDVDQGSTRLSGKATLKRLDLKRIARKLGQFFDLGDLELAGAGEALVRWQRQADGGMHANCQSSFNNFVIRRGGRELWNERLLQLSLTATCQPDPNNSHVDNLEAAELAVKSGKDQFEAKLLRPVPLARANQTDATPGSWRVRPDQSWPISADLRGDVGRWMARVESVLGRQDWQVAGEGHVMATVYASPKLIDVRDLQTAVRGFRARTEGLLIDEPKLAFQLVGKWHPEAGRADIEFAELFSAIDVKTEGATLTLPSVGETLPTAKGDVWFHVKDLARVQRWMLPAPGTKPGYRLGGTAKGWLSLQHASDIANAKINAAIIDMALQTAGSPKVWRDPKVTVQGEVRYDRPRDLLEILGLDIAAKSQPIGGSVSGRIARLSDRRELDLRGNLTYDLEQIVHLLCPSVENDVRIEGGRRDRPFALTGVLGQAPGQQPKPLLARLQTGTEVNWTGADVFGLRFDSGRVQAQLRDGQVLFQPIKLSVNGGRVAAQPRIDLASMPSKAYERGGRILDRVQITPEMCNRGLQYALPMLHGVSQAQGQFSVDLNPGCVVPLDNPKMATASGNITVHDVTLTPGPMLRSIAQALDAVALATGKQGQFTSQLRVAQLKRESVIPYQMAGGRVNHQDMELDFGGTRVKTSGWVDLNTQRMELVAKVASPKLARAVRGMNAEGEIVIPIEGTPQQPRIDEAKLLKSLPGLIGAGMLDRVPGADKLRNEFDKLDKKAGGLFRGMFGPKK